MPRLGTVGASFAAWLSCVLLCVDASAAPGDEAKIRCQAAYEHAQQLRRDGRLSASRVELRVCEETCPATLRPDCERWLAEITTLLPTLRVRAKSSAGERLRDVRVLVDGKLLADPATDEPLMVDPGERVLRFERTGADPLEIKVALEPGERDHLVEVTIASRSAPSSAADLGHGAPSRVPSYVLGVAGLTALSVGGVLAVKGHVDRAELSDTCSPACDPARVDPIRTLWWTAAVAAGAGVASLSLAVLLWPSTAPRRSTAAVRADIVPSLGGVALAGHF